MDFRRIFLENWPIKLTSLVLAVALWFYVTATGKTEISLTIPLELRNIPQGMAVVGDVPGKLDIRLQGQERVLRDIAFGKKVVGVLDLASAHEGESIIRISPDDIRRPIGLVVTYLAPYEVRVVLERIIQRTIRLRPVVTGAPAPGFRLQGIMVSPSRLSIEGPAGVLNGLESLSTMPIDIRGISRNLTIEPRIDYHGKTIKVLDKDISVSIAIKKEKP